MPHHPARLGRVIRGRSRSRTRIAADDFGDYLRLETTGGIVLLLAAVGALVWANSPVGSSYLGLRGITFGPSALDLRLDVESWAADGLLAIFFFVAGLEVKRELVVGELRDRRKAALPVIAAVAGMVVPALVFLAVSVGEPGAGRAWAVPVATDIAFALGVLAVTGSHLPGSLRIFLLSLAVVDDLGAIALIAVLYTDALSLLPAAGAVLLLGAYALLQRRRITTPLLYVPLALTVWGLVHASGVHATVAGIALGLLTRVRTDPGEDEAPAERLEHRLQPWSAGVVVPIFALLSAGVVVSADGLREAAGDRIVLGIIAGLVLGKAIGVFGGAWLAVRLRVAALPDDLVWRDVLGVAVLAGCGFTVSLLVAELALVDPAAVDRAKIGVLVASTIAATTSALMLHRRSRARVRSQRVQEPAAG